jgi:hypothetical protein
MVLIVAYTPTAVMNKQATMLKICLMLRGLFGENVMFGAELSSPDSSFGASPVETSDGFVCASVDGVGSTDSSQRLPPPAIIQRPLEFFVVIALLFSLAHCQRSILPQFTATCGIDKIKGQTENNIVS